MALLRWHSIFSYHVCPVECVIDCAAFSRCTTYHDQNWIFLLRRQSFVVRRRASHKFHNIFSHFSFFSFYKFSFILFLSFPCYSLSIHPLNLQNHTATARACLSVTAFLFERNRFLVLCSAAFCRRRILRGPNATLGNHAILCSLFLRWLNSSKNSKGLFKIRPLFVVFFKGNWIDPSATKVYSRSRTKQQSGPFMPSDFIFDKILNAAIWRTAL